MIKKNILLLLIVLVSIACSESQTAHKKSIQEYHTTITTKHNNRMGISIYYKEENIKKPTIYFLSASTSDRRSYEHIFHYLVKEGYVVVGLSTQSFASDYIMYHFYDALQFGRNFCKEKGITDDTRVGLIGHSSGAGILPSLGYKVFTEDGIGSNGRFIWGASPWIDFQYNNMMKLPKDTNFVTVLFENDHSTDPRIYLDMFKHIDVKHKSFIMVKKGGTHQTIFYPEPKELVYNGILKPLTDLASYTFKDKNKNSIFPTKDIEHSYLNITEENKLPKQNTYLKMLKNFRWSHSSFGCKPTSNYAPNPREKECLEYKND